MFRTDQEIRLSERARLQTLGLEVGIEVEAYHLERIAAIRDRPHTAPVRKQYLDINPPPSR